MNTQKMKWLLILIIAIGLISATTTALANTIYFPLLANEASPTPTLTQTPTATLSVTLTPTRTPTRTPTPTLEPGVYIIDINNNPDGNDLDTEYVEIENDGSRSVDMKGWKLRDENRNVYTFPAFTLKKGANVKVWTKAGTNTSSNLYWGRTAPVWNKKHDCAHLRDENGDRVDDMCYNMLSEQIGFGE
jgi:hypothetical protein